MRNYKIKAVGKSVYCSSTGHYSINIVVGVKYGNDYQSMKTDFTLGIGNGWWERAPKYLQAEMWREVFARFDAGEFTFHEYDSFGRQRDVDLRYADAEQFASMLELYREELK